MIRRTICCIALLFSALPAAAQVSSEEHPPSTAAASPNGVSPKSRTELLKSQRRAKFDEMTPPRRNMIEKYIKDLDQKGTNTVEEANFWRFHPRLDWISGNSGIAPGVRYWNPGIIGPVDVMGAAFYSWKRYQYYDLQVGMIPNRGKRIPARSFETVNVDQLGDIDREAFSRFKLYASARFRDRTDESYHGSGPDTEKDENAHYRIKDVLSEIVTGYQLTHHIAFTVKAGLLQNSLAEGRSDPSLEEEFSQSSGPPDNSLPGSQMPPNYVLTHTSFFLDYRDDPGVPHKGFIFSFGWEKYDNINSNNLFNFHRFGADFRFFIPLGSRQQVIAFRTMGVDSDPAPDNYIPFFLQPALGGAESLRGYDGNRFRGDKVLLIQCEYRWEASRRIELALFGDTGTVADQGERLSINKMKSDVGGGFRFKSSRATLFRLDLAGSNEGVYFQFRTSKSF